MKLFRAGLFALVAGSAAVSVTVTSTPQAHAKKKKARKAKRKGKKASAKADETKKAAEAQAEAEERKAPAKFSWTARSPKQKMDTRADSKRDEAILKLQKLLPSVSDGPQKAELIFRLSEMYWAKSKFMNLQAMQLWDQQLEAWSKDGQKGPEPKLQDIEQLGKSDAYKRQALDLYETILAKYENYHRKDEVLYNLGSSLYEAGKKKEGVKRYWALIKQFPESEYAADAWLELGEHFFNSNKLTQAVTAYTKAAETKKPRIYSFALYKLAWCDYNLGEYDAALLKFREVVDYSERSKEGEGFAGRDKVQLKEEALMDMVRTYSHLDSVDDAFEYYQTKVGKDKAYRYLHKLGNKYDEEGKFALEIRTFKRLNEQYPYAAQAPENQTAIMTAYASAGKKDKVRAEVRRLVDLYAPNGTWAKKNASNQRVLDQAFEIVEEKLSGLVTEQHREAQETKLSSTYKLARDIYKEYLSKFSDSANSYRFRFFYAEILFELKEFGPAAEQYDLVVVSKEDGEFARHSAYAAILSWEKVAAGVKEDVGAKITQVKRGKSKGRLKELEKLQTLTKGKKYDPTPLADAEKKLADACDNFVRVAPKDDEVVKVKFKSARLYYIHNQFDEAATRFGEIIDRWPKDELARKGADSIVQSFNVRQDWSNLNKWSRQFRGNKLLMADKSFAKNINQLVEGSTFNEIHFVFEPKETEEQVAGRYEAFVTEFPKSKYAMVGLFNAVVNYDKSNRLEKSLELSNKILTAYKDFKVSKEDVSESKKDGAKLPEPEDIREKTMFLAGSFHERLAEFEEAADLYEAYVEEFSKGPKRSDAMFNAALFREGLGEYDKAIDNFRAYIKAYPSKEDVADIAWRIGTIFEKKEDLKAVKSHFGSIGAYTKDNPARQLCADYKVASVLKKEGDTKGLAVAYDKILASYKKLPKSDMTKPCPLKAAAEAAFAAVEKEYEAYVAIPLAGVSDKVLEKNLIKKLQLVEEIQSKYTQVLAIGQGDYGIASLYRIGQVYQHLAQGIFATQCPRALTEDQCMIYQAALQEQAFPLEEKSIEAFDKALAKAYELGLYNEWLAKAQDALRTYEPGRFPEIHQYDLVASEASLEVPALVELK